MKPFQIRTRHTLLRSPFWHENQDGESINAELLRRIKALTAHLLEHELVTGDITLNEGVRSRRRAHMMSTSWFLRQPHGSEPSKIPLANLRALPGGRDLDGNAWYDPRWNTMLVPLGLPPDNPRDIVYTPQSLQKVWELIRERAYQIKPQSALAAEGYEIHDPRILPNVHTTVSNHVGGNAIDCHIDWRRGAVVPKYASGGLTPPNPWGMYESKPTARLLIIDGGLNDAAANYVIEAFGLCRPVKGANPEPWHFQLAPHRKPLVRP